MLVPDTRYRTSHHQPVEASVSLRAALPYPLRRRPTPRLVAGKTTKNHTRHFAIHDYHDHAQDLQVGMRMMCGVTADSHDLFPVKLHALLDDAERKGLDHIISWAPHGRCFMIHDPKEYMAQVMPSYFHQSKLTSFQRQLNLYGFRRLTHGPDKSGYYNEYFLRGKPSLSQYIERVKVKGTQIKAAGSPDQEPDFYALPAIGLSEVFNFGRTSGVGQVSETTATPSTASIVSLPVKLSVDNAALLSQNTDVALAMDTGRITSDCTTDECPAPDPIYEELSDPELDIAIGDFCSDWDPNADASFNLTLGNDWLLGFMVDQIGNE